jgi:LuxR family maltose regulon positive regulatory protein
MVLGELYIQQGTFSKAKAMFEQTIASVSEQNQIPILLASLHLGLAKIAFLQGENRAAYSLLEESKSYGQKYALMDWKYKYNLLLARIYCSEGLYGMARDSLSEAKANYFVNPLPDEITLEDMEIMIDQAETPQLDNPNNQQTNNQQSIHPYPIQASDGSGKLGFPKEHANQSLSDPLTMRELEVLELIAAGSSNQEICDTLFLALSTVKSYNQNIFGKLQVSRRTQAVAKAKELGLV